MLEWLFSFASQVVACPLSFSSLVGIVLLDPETASTRAAGEDQHVAARWAAQYLQLVTAEDASRGDGCVRRRQIWIGRFGPGKIGSSSCATAAGGDTGDRTTKQMPPQLDVVHVVSAVSEQAVISGSAKMRSTRHRPPASSIPCKMSIL